MFRVIEKPDEIVIQEIPLKKWLIKVLIFLLFSGFVLFIANDLINLLFAHGISFLIGGVSLLLNPLIITRITPTAQTVEVIRRFLFFIKRTERFYFSQIKGFEIRRRKRGNAGLYFNVLKLINNSVIELQLNGTKTNSIKVTRTNLNKLIKKAKLPFAENERQLGKVGKFKRQK